MTSSPALTYCQNRLCGMMRFALRGVMWLAVLFAVLILLLRYVLLPNISYYHQEVTTLVSETIGAPVSIGQFYADWDGLDPRMTLLNVNVLDPQHRPALVLPEVNVRISWWSLPTLQLRLAWLEINHAVLHIQRDTQGKILIGGIALAEQSGGNSDMTDWLLHQSDMVIKAAKIVWQDHKRAAPPLVLNAVNLRIANRFDRHRFALYAAPDARLSSPLEVRGDFEGHSFAALKSWRGQVFTQLDHADMTAWRPWFNLPQEFSHGQGGLRGWLEIAHGRITHLTGDLAVQDVVTKLSDDVPEMVLHHLNGRAKWGEIAGGFEVSTENLTMRLKNGVALPTTNLRVKIADANGDTPAHGEMRANRLQLETLVSLANFIPLPAAWRAQLDGYAPRGRVSNLDVSWHGTGVEHFKVKGDFEQFGLAQFGRIPGFENLSAHIEGDDHAGMMRLHSHQLYLDAPEILREPIALDTVTMLLNWRHDAEQWAIDVPQLAASNADFAGSAAIRYQTAPKSPGVLDLTVKLARADVGKVARYTPLFAVTPDVSNWLDSALLAGKSEDFYLRIKGNLNDFPFEDNGIFELSASVQAGKLQFSNDWPSVENITGNLLMQGKQLAFNSQTATMLDVPTHTVVVQVPDLVADKTTLLVNVDADADSGDFLRLVKGSPIRGYTDGFTDRIVATGNGHLDLYIRLPEIGKPSAEVRSRYLIKENEIALGGSVPIMRHASGELVFTESSFYTQALRAEILGDIATLDIQTHPDGRVAAQVQGNSRIAALRQAYPHPVWDKLQGNTAWQVQVSVEHKLPQVVLTTDLQGVQSYLPAPFDKPADAVRPVRISMTGTEQETIQIQFAELFNARLSRHNEVIQRGTLHFGGQGEWVDQDGLWIVGHLPLLAVQGWEGLSGKVDNNSGLRVAVQNLHIAELTGYGQSLHEVTVNARQREDGFVAELESKALSGEFLWQQGAQPKLTANIQHLNFQGDKSVAPATTELKHSPINPGGLPALALSIAQLQLKNKRIGKVVLTGQPEGGNWRLTQLQVLNPDGSLTGEGVWHGGNYPRTQVNAVLHISDAGKVMARSGYPKTVEKGSGTLAAQLAWNGTPMMFNYASLNGTLKLDTTQGRFLKIEPGIAKLLGILSLQALPKHIALDFTDVFSDGFQFDNINGNALIKNGIMTTQDLHIDGSSAKVTMQGQVNLNQETQQLRVVILPAVGEGFSLLSGFAGGPIVGVGTLLLSKIMGNPFDKLVSFQYNIGGTWEHPAIVKVGQTPVKVILPAKPEK